MYRLLAMIYILKKEQLTFGYLQEMGKTVKFGGEGC